jgi:hypothetical protein
MRMNAMTRSDTRRALGLNDSPLSFDLGPLTFARRLAATQRSGEKPNLNPPGPPSPLQFQPSLPG